MHVLNRVDEPSALRRFTLRHGLSVFPAIINVLRGDMSFIGPRVVAPVDPGSLNLRERLRFDARPGITGLARVSAAEDVCSRDELEALDAYYVQGWSLGGDAKILMRWSMQCFLGWVHVSGEPGSFGAPTASEELAESGASGDH
jgi:lipopolysaccharide/colanic/teichoic acid biosynthesis glycosyltransferase